MLVVHDFYPGPSDCPRYAGSDTSVGWTRPLGRGARWMSRGASRPRSYESATGVLASSSTYSAGIPLARAALTIGSRYDATSSRRSFRRVRRTPRRRARRRVDLRLSRAHRDSRRRRRPGRGTCTWAGSRAARRTRLEPHGRSECPRGHVNGLHCRRPRDAPPRDRAWLHQGGSPSGGARPRHGDRPHRCR
jgi:hypothetical protein